MAHIGKLYPRYNPARILVSTTPYPLWYPTEYRWSVGFWTGTLAPLAPLSGRGMLPSPPAPGGYTFEFRADLGLIGGYACALSVVCGVETVTYTQRSSVQVYVGGVPQLTPVFGPQGGVPLEELVLEPSHNWTNPVTGLLFLQSPLDLFAYKWTDPPPPPPRSAPY